jgi:hypothetical protein
MGRLYRRREGWVTEQELTNQSQEGEEKTELWVRQLETLGPENGNCERTEGLEI